MTVWERLAEAVAALPEPFGRQNVLRWFAEYHPEINQRSVAAHLQLATSNAPVASRGSFASRTPLVTRSGWGEYRAYHSDTETLWVSKVPQPEAVTVSPSEASASHDFDIVLVSCGRAKRSDPGRAADLYTSDGFRKRRAIAEDAGGSWFILSAEHGLVAPDEWLAPYDLALAKAPTEYRVAWGQWVTARLAYKAGGLRGQSILVLAPAPYSSVILPQLVAAGAAVQDRLAGLRQGEQGAWLTSEVRRRGIDLPLSEPDMPTSMPLTTKVADRGAVVAALLEFRQGHEQLNPSRLGYAQTAEGDAFLQEDPFAFLLGVILDEGITAERAWQGPLELKRRLGHLDPWLLRAQANAVRGAIAAPPAIHRYTEIMASAVVEAADRVITVYDGDAGRLWAPGSTASEVDARFREFYKVGPKKAAMAVELLVSHFGVELADLAGTNVAFDVHVRRVFLRSGLVDRDELGLVTAAARELYPDRPGLLDLPTWMIGRQWCHPTGPNCPECPLAAVCPRLIDRNV